MVKKVVLLTVAAFATAGFASECKSEFCQYKALFENPPQNSEAQGNAPSQTTKPIPVFKVPPPPQSQANESTGLDKNLQVKSSNYQTFEGLKPLKAVEVVSTPSAAVEVSLENVNRIVCPAGLKGFVYSKEKFVKVERSGNSLYVKFLPVKEWNSKEGRVELRYPDFPRDLFVECGPTTFSLVLVPKRGLPPKEVYLRVPYTGERKKAERFERSFPYEETLIELIKYAYKDTPPPGYDVKFVGKPFTEFKELSLYLNRVYEGNSFRVLEFILTAKQNLNLEEGMFVPYFPKAAAIAIETPMLKRGEMTRLFVVEKLGGD